MPIYQTADEFIGVLGQVANLVKSSDAAKSLHEAGLVVAFVYHHPHVTVLMDGRTPTQDGSYMTMTFHQDSPPADVSFESSSDVGHQFWSGHLDVPNALARGQVKAKGAITKALKLIPLLPPLYAAYNQVRQEKDPSKSIGD